MSVSKSDLNVCISIPMSRDSIRVSECSTTSDGVIIIFSHLLFYYWSFYYSSIYLMSHLSFVSSINCRFYLLSFYVLSYTRKIQLWMLAGQLGLGSTQPESTRRAFNYRRTSGGKIGQCSHWTFRPMSISAHNQIGLYNLAHRYYNV